MDSYLPYFYLCGVAVAALGFVALVAVAFQTHFAWGLGVLAFPPLGPVFSLKHPRRAAAPAAILGAGLLLVVGPIAYNRLVPIDLGPREKVVDGEVHLTLTGWDQCDYSLIARKADVVVLQMANPDVGDGALRHVTGLGKLRELDLNGSKVTDQGLKFLAGLDRLESIRLRDTGVTDAGFRESLASLGALKQLDLRGTKVSKELSDSWRALKPGRRVLQ